MRKFVYLCFGILLVWACDTAIDNPYDGINDDNNNQVQNEDTLDPSTISYLQHKIFKPTCANSGCHDGTFEPNFTTIQSSYNTLVNHSVIKNNNAGSYTYRVQPGNANASIIIERMSGMMDGTNDQMPIVVDPSSDYNANRAKYISNVRDWINQGAKDLFGNSPTIGNLPAQLEGVFAVDVSTGGNDLLPRENGQGAIIIPANSTSVEIWVALTDDSTQSSNISSKIKFSTEIDDFSNSALQNMSVAGTPRMELGYFGDTETYYHVIPVNPQLLGPAPETYIYFRIEATDNSGLTAIIPNNSSFTYFKQYLSLIQEA